MELIVEGSRGIILIPENRETEQPSEARRLEITPWFYFVPWAGVCYYSYQESPSPVNGERLSVTADGYAGHCSMV